MEFYLAKDKFVLGVAGGEFYTLNSEPKAVILTKEPVPTKKWTIPSVIDKTLFEGEEWTIETEFREFLCDEKKVYIFQFEYHRTVPGYCCGKAEFFVTEEYAREKIDSLRKTSKISEYNWDATKPTWREVQQKLYYRKV
ncbi:hypothetical protein [Neobacillus sp. FSL H8-0543]|uniref:hypothetical protein n=1 Tax=Neobacillus sp. FSL H8-0543 TaxID=2954672 RepID=UPI003158CCCE